MAIKNGTSNSDILVGTADADTLNGFAGNDVLSGLGGADILDGGSGTDTADYSTAASAVSVHLESGKGFLGDALGDIYTGIENATGSKFNDFLSAGLASATLKGNAGNDVLVGSLTGADVLVGGLGADSLSGNGGADRYTYQTMDDSGVSAGKRDIIFGFSHAQGDKIDLSAIDANPGKAGDQAFTSSQLAVSDDGTNTHLTVITSTDLMEIEFKGHVKLDSSDFIL